MYVSKDRSVRVRTDSERKLSGKERRSLGLPVEKPGGIGIHGSGCWSSREGGGRFGVVMVVFEGMGCGDSVSVWNYYF